MLCITTSTCYTRLIYGKTNEHHWHVGEPKPCQFYSDGETTEDFPDVIEIQADGHELEHIRKRFTNIPDVPGARVVTWSGDIARFIYNHLTHIPI